RSNNTFDSQATLRRLDSLLADPQADASTIRTYRYRKSMVMLELGEEEKAVRLLEPLVRERPEELRMIKRLALSYLRLAERSNCVMDHASASCILPIAGPGIHTDVTGSKKAIELYERVLKRDPHDLESRWLLNLAYMTLGAYPDDVPPAYFIPGLKGENDHQVEPFEDIAGDLKLEINNMSGGSIAEDFDNDGLIDLITSGWGNREIMHYFRNRGDGTFEDRSRMAGLEGITGGLNIMQTDYNNDGLKDVFVLRGAWRRQFGCIPNSLLRNNGDGTFTDVTFESGLLSFHPTQTATWNDFNNDGWLDVFIGNETTEEEGVRHPCELFMSNQDGTFYDAATAASCDITQFVKGVTSGDYDNDGWQDIFVSTLDGNRKLLRNIGSRSGTVAFEDVTTSAGLSREKARTFPTWFWDFDNDGWLDIFACDYSFEQSLAADMAAEKLGIDDPSKDKMLLYRNNRDGTFTNVAREMGLNTNAFAMGSNFGDINNDGFLDMYLGTGNPLYESLIPNRMFLNLQGKAFADVTASARVGHLQKGHGVSFADMDNDGDQDIYTDMGGAFPGDAYQNSFFLNPGQGDNHWIVLSLEGRSSNRAAIGTRVKITFKENGVQRSVYRDVNSGGSFGSSPHRREIGVGKTTVIDEIEITWSGGRNTEVFNNVKTNQFLRIIEGDNRMIREHPARIQWTLPNRLCAE
ncbi:MAG TPA: CRTAC1 family protein, partial [Chryseolinea sp.]|nr:CRTAC1 family protein [Chryseolinea sp.]